MIEIIYGRQDDGTAAMISRWVAGHIPGCERGFGPGAAIAVAEDDELIGATVFHNFSPEAGVVEMSSAAVSPRWLQPRMIRAIFGYAFDQLACQMVVMRVSERNERMRSIAERFGFTGHLIPRLRGRDENEWVFTLTGEAWRNHKLMRSTIGQA